MELNKSERINLLNVNQRGDSSFLAYLSRIHKSWEIVAKYPVHSFRERECQLCYHPHGELWCSIKKFLLGSHLIKLGMDMIDLIITNNKFLELDKKKLLNLSSLSCGCCFGGGDFNITFNISLQFLFFYWGIIDICHYINFKYTA